MATRILAGGGIQTLVVAGNAHTPVSHTELGVPMGAHLAQRRPGVREIRINYDGGHYYNLQPGRFAAIGPQRRQIRLYQHDDMLILDLPSASEAVVPQRSQPGPRESFTKTEIGDRDGWVCGICQDTTRLVDPGPGAPRALSPSIDHIVPLSDGGQHIRANVRIAHLWCNVERNSAEAPPTEYMRARLSQILNGTPIPEELDRSCFPSWQWPARPRIEYMIALSIAVGWVAADPRYGEPATRLADAAVD